MKESTVKGNEVISIFMGSVRHSEGDLGEDYKYFIGTGMLGGFSLHFQYHTSWDWLMPVVEKIESLGLFEIRMQHTMVKVHCFDPFRMHIIHVETVHSPQQKLEATYKCVLKFIEWYTSITTKEKV
jgi:hypothetical protein